MKWSSFIILSLIAMICQSIARDLAIYSIWPDCMFILAVHYALWGPWPDAAIAAWILGMLLGTQTLDPLGLHAFCYGVAAWGIMKMRQVVFREHALTQFVTALFFTLLVQFMVGSFKWWRGSNDLTLTQMLWTALFTAVLTPFLHWPLLRLGRWTGLRAVQRAAGHRR